MSTMVNPASMALAALRRSVRGEVIEPGDREYDAARAVWNGMIDRKPELIVRCAGTPDVVAVVRFARERGKPIAVRGGGHNAAGLAVADGALVIDLSGMTTVEVDPTRKTATAGGGATWGVFDAETQAFGLATTGGAISSTGVGGLTLGGGLGWLMRTHGLAADNLIAAEIVTAEGEVVSTSEQQYPELLWGLRGGGGNFGVVTKLTFRLHEVGPVLAGMVVHPIAQAPAVLRFFREYTASAPETVTAYCAQLHTPDGIPVVALIVCAIGDLAAAEQALQPLRAFGAPVADTIAPMAYTAVQSMLDEGFPSGLPVYWRSHFLPNLPDAALDTLTAAYGSVNSPLSIVLLEHVGGAVKRVPAEATAYDQRGSDYNLAVISRWPEAEMAGAGIAWARTLHDAMTPFAEGVYVNYLGVGDAAERVRAAYGAEKYGRLAALKRQFDPENIFRFNQNIKPE